MARVADSAEAEVSADESVEAELGVETVVAGLQVLSMERRSLEGRAVGGAGWAGGS